MSLPLGQLGDLGKMFEGMKERPELDKTKEALKELKKDVEAGKPIEIENIHKLFILDMEELDIKDPKKQEEYWQKIKLEIETMLLQETPDFKNLNAFTINLENLAGLRKIIDSKKPKAKAESWIKGLREKYPNLEWVFGGLATYLTSMADEWKKKNKDKTKDTFWGKKVREIAGWLGGAETEEGKKDDAPATTPAATAAAAGQAEAEARQSTPEIDKLKPKLRAIAEKFINKTDKGFGQIDAKTLEADYKALIDSGIKENELNELLDRGLSDIGRLFKIKDAIKSVHSKAFEFRLADIRLQKFTDDQITSIEDAIKTKIKTDKDSIRKFLNGIREDPSKIAQLIEENKKTA